jgi:hypothetical protein
MAAVTQIRFDTPGLRRGRHPGYLADNSQRRRLVRIAYPEDLRLQIETALLELADPVGEVWDDSIGKLYEWEGINRAADDDWDWLRTVLEAAEFSIDDQQLRGKVDRRRVSKRALKPPI